jgi:hypothetical protein
LILLDRPLGWSRLTALLQDGRREMLDRYTGLSVVRFFAQYCPDRIHRDILAEAIDPLLDQPDMADIVVEQYRLWGRWEKTGRIVSLYGRGGFNLPGIKRPVLRFALSCPEQTPGRVKAAALVRALRELAPEWVADAEELLRLEEQSRREEADRKKTVPQP